MYHDLEESSNWRGESSFTNLYLHFMFAGGERAGYEHLGF